MLVRVITSHTKASIASQCEPADQDVLHVERSRDFGEILLRSLPRHRIELDGLLAEFLSVGLEVFGRGLIALWELERLAEVGSNGSDSLVETLKLTCETSM